MVYLAHRVNQMKEGLNTPSPSGWVVELNIYRTFVIFLVRKIILR